MGQHPTVRLLLHCYHSDRYSMLNGDRYSSVSMIWMVLPNSQPGFKQLQISSLAQRPRLDVVDWCTGNNGKTINSVFREYFISLCCQAPKTCFGTPLECNANLIVWPDSEKLTLENFVNFPGRRLSFPWGKASFCPLWGVRHRAAHVDLFSNLFVFMFFFFQILCLSMWSRGAGREPSFTRWAEMEASKYHEITVNDMVLIVYLHIPSPFGGPCLMQHTIFLSSDRLKCSETVRVVTKQQTTWSFPFPFPPSSSHRPLGSCCYSTFMRKFATVRQTYV